MARKSSKTAHVMNLLAGENSESESSKSEAAKENLAAKTADSTDTIKELTVLAKQASIQTQEGSLSPSPISIIDMTSSTPDPVAELIKNELEKEDVPSEAEPEPEESISSAVSEEEPPAEQTTWDTPESETQDIQQPPVSQTPSYQYLNVMEEAVKSMLKEYMDKFQVCTCDRCTADVMALTLSNLTPKHIVVDTSAVSPLLNFYSNYFSQQIIVELTKACTTVKEHPRH